MIRSNGWMVQMPIILTIWEEGLCPPVRAIAFKFAKAILEAVQPGFGMLPIVTPKRSLSVSLYSLNLGHTEPLTGLGELRCQFYEKIYLVAVNFVSLHFVFALIFFLLFRRI
jgi:hypothetical protein